MRIEKRKSYPQGYSHFVQVFPIFTGVEKAGFALSLRHFKKKSLDGAGFLLYNTQCAFFRKQL